MSLKKNLATKEKKHLFFFDESKFGTHSKIGHGWFKKGKRTSVKIKLGFQNFYIYSAVNPTSGESFTLKLPRVDTVCMNVFLKELSGELNGAEINLVMDGAGWHKSKDLVVPENITIIILPPYSPELNPVERLWLYIKQNTIRSKIYENIASLEDAVCDFIKTLEIDQIKQVCSFGY